MGSTNLRRTEEEWRGQDRNRLKKTERNDQTKPSTNTNNTEIFKPMRWHDLCESTRHSPVILHDEHKKYDAQISRHHLTLGEIRVLKNTDGTQYLGRDFPTKTQ